MKLSVRRVRVRMKHQISYDQLGKSAKHQTVSIEALQSLESVVRADLDSMNHTISGIFRKVEAENERRDAEIRTHMDAALR